ncbi:MAG: hypothetical protein M1827_003225 [Pycnora praestabilis]|nr:MAG: hypothetical protein M1827_003225 [Pycnora praestabilis]
MSSGFVSGGTAEEPAERDDEWLKAQQEIEATRRRKEEESRQQGGRTLFETLQANKGEYGEHIVGVGVKVSKTDILAAKQDAFEESIRLKNQFRSLDEDEIEFLDSVLESTRAQEEAVKRETTEQLDLFRRQQEEADKALLVDAERTNADSGSLPVEEEQWVINGRKRKKGKDKEGLKGVKLRKSSSTRERPPAPITPAAAIKIDPHGQANSSPSASLTKSPVKQQQVVDKSGPHGRAANPPPQAVQSVVNVTAPRGSIPPVEGALGSGLVQYSSDEDD